MNTIIEKIRAEIERLKGQLVRGACAAQIEMETNCKDEAYDEMLAILDTLQEQPVDTSEDERIRRWLVEKVKGGNYPWADWENKVIAYINRQSKEQPVCEGLEEEIENYLDHADLKTKCNGISAAQDYFDDLTNLARHFAKWGAEHAKKNK